MLNFDLLNFFRWLKPNGNRCIISGTKSIAVAFKQRKNKFIKILQIFQSCKS